MSLPSAAVHSPHLRPPSTQLSPLRVQLLWARCRQSAGPSFVAGRSEGCSGPLLEHGYLRSYTRGGEARGMRQEQCRSTPGSFFAARISGFYLSGFTTLLSGAGPPASRPCRQIFSSHGGQQPAPLMYLGGRPLDHSHWYGLQATHAGGLCSVQMLSPSQGHAGRPSCRI